MSRVCLRWDYFFRLPFGIYRVACVELAHSSLGDWKNIFITHLIIIIKSEVSTFPIVVIFFRGCVSEMVVLSYSVIYYIYIPGKLGLCFHFWCSVYGICKRSDTSWRMIARMRWAQKMLAGYIMSRVCLRWDYFFRLPFCIYRVACVELAHSSLGDWKNIFITHLIIIIKSEVSTFPIVVIFFRGCVSEMVVLSYSVIYYIYIPMFSLWHLQTIGYIMACRSCSFVCRLHHLIIIIMQTNLKALNY